MRWALHSAQLLAVVVAAALLLAPRNTAWSKIMFDRFERPRVVVVERPWPPLVEVWVQLPVGALADPDGKEGLTHVTWQTAIEAGGDRDGKAFSGRLDAIGATIDADIGGRTTIVHGRVPARHIEDFMALLADAVLRPGLRKSDFKRQRQLAEADAMALLDDDESLADDAARRYLHRAGPAGRALEGTPESLKTLKARDARALHEQAIRTTMRFGFAGSLPRQKALKLVARYFPDTSGKKRALANRESPPPKLAGRRLLLLNRQGRSQAQVVIIVPTVGASSAAMPAMMVAATALGGTFTSRLVRQIRELRGWSYTLDAGLSVSHASGALIIRWAPENRVAAPSIDLVMSQLELLKSGGLTGKELAFVQDHLRGAHRLAIETAAGELAERMRALSLGLPIDYPQRLSAMIGRVDKKRLHKALAAHFDPSRAVAVVVGDAVVLSTSLQRMTSGFALETIPYTGHPERTTVVGTPVTRTLLGKPPPPADPDASPEYGPLFDADGNPIDPASLPTGDTGTDDDEDGDDDAPTEPPTDAP